MPEDFPRIVADALVQYQSLALIVMAIGFAALELILPHYPVDRRRDLFLDFVGVVAGFAFVAVSYSALRWLVSLAGDPSWDRAMSAPRELPSMVKVLLVVLIVDFSIYWLHVFMHRYRFAWRMHRWHHSIEQMYWFAGFRASFLHILIYGIPQVAVPMIVFDLSLSEMMVASAVGNFVQIWTHTNLKVNLGPLQWLIVTPDYHRVHHRAGDGPAKNLGNLLTVWDRLLGTYEAADQSAVDHCGLVEPRPGLIRMMLGI
jgi:sterol desaturase/sphingolipid hydroxylase (fatty acid hydroxylase superfamily)